MLKKMLALCLTVLLFCSFFTVSASDYAMPEGLSDEEISTFFEQLEATEAAEASAKPEDASAQMPALNLAAKSAVLIEASTGKILYDQNKDVELAPASITKIMTLILIMEELDSGRLKTDDVITVSENAANLGGSQIYMEVGEQLTVDEMLKSIVVVSANDACVAMAEHIAGSTDLFVQRMNEKAKELGMEHTNFVNCHGLDTEGHKTTAYDVALMSQELIKHDKIHEYSTIWMDTVRGGQFQLANTNKMLKTYPGVNGLKTGSTSNAKYCLSVTAVRDDMELIGVILGAENSKVRFAEASRLMDYGFGAFSKVQIENTDPISPIVVLKGKKTTAPLEACKTKLEMIIPKNSGGETRVETEISENIIAPAEKGQKVGTISFYLNDEKVGEGDIVIAETVLKETFFGYFSKLANGLFMLGV